METTQELEVSYSLTYTERLRAAWELTVGSPTAILWLCFFPVLGALLLWLMRWPSNHNPGWDYLLVMVCFTIVPCLFMWITYRSHRDDQKKGTYKYRFNAEGIHIANANLELTHRWPAIERVRVTGSMLYLYFTPRNAHCIPVRALPSAGAVEAIRQMAIAGGVPRDGA